MQYHDYIAADNARREREQQLLNKYSQPKCEHRVQNIWMHQVERHETSPTSGKEIWSIIGGLLLVAALIALSIWI